MGDLGPGPCVETVDEDEKVDVRLLVVLASRLRSEEAKVAQTGPSSSRTASRKLSTTSRSSGRRRDRASVAVMLETMHPG
jgi:hypothetical protein